MSLESYRRDIVKNVIEENGDAVVIKGPDFEKGVLSLSDYISSMSKFGVQGSHLGLAVDEVNKMIKWKPEDDLKLREQIRKERIKKHLLEKKIKSGASTCVDVTEKEVDDEYKIRNKRYEEEGRNDDMRDLDPDSRCFIYLGLCSSVISSGMREVVAYLCKHSMVDVVVTTGGGVEEDIMKCLAPTYRGDFKVSEDYCVDNGINRIANMLVPNKNYEMLEKFLLPVLYDCHVYQSCAGYTYTPSRMIRHFGMELSKYADEGGNDKPKRGMLPILKDTKQVPGMTKGVVNSRRVCNDDDDENPIPHNINNSFIYWCYKNAIPVFCPSFVDGSLGSIMYTHNTRTPGLVVDIVGDIRGMNDSTGAGCSIDKERILKIHEFNIKKEKGEEIKDYVALPKEIPFSYSSPAVKRGIILIGGGTIKHHIANANLLGRTDCAVDEGSSSSDEQDNDSGEREEMRAKQDGDSNNNKDEGDKNKSSGTNKKGEEEEEEQEDDIPDGGAHFCVYINTSQEYDSSDSGASPDEAVSWGKIHPRATPVKVWCEQSIAFGLLVAGSFVMSYNTPEGKARWDEKTAVRRVISSYMDKEYHQRKKSGYKTKEDKEHIPAYGNDYLTAYYSSKHYNETKAKAALK